MLETYPNKSSFVLEKLARYFIQVNHGDRILTISELLELAPVSRGTVQNSLQILKDVNAIEVESRGKLGSFLLNKDVDKLLKFASINLIMGVMPLPYSPVYEGLASGVLASKSVGLPVPVSMAYMKGSENRIEAVLSGKYDYAIVSYASALNWLKEHPYSIDVLLRMGNETLVKEIKRIEKINKKTKSKKRVGLDLHIEDQVLLSKNFYKDEDVDFVPIDGQRLFQLFSNDIIDEIIWNYDEINFALDSLISHELEPFEELNDMTEAVVIIAQERADLSLVLKEHLNLETIKDIQNQVIEGTMIPYY
ncbi:GntR family transcriptional regulator YhfZ [Erysipelothrix urinaevulpis]|uniref:GntR family transcriptional regulator YhfZ n=1 Tax=Erysipelothrix urinaevulpis TaxID=2683717 RepID=UPI0013568EB5|nr:GntR family transcriptional regulator YhfZ [Erysipelothrix urinaevulpis]